jgi:hypothetical protein
LGINEIFYQTGMYDYQVTAEWSRMMYENKADKVFNLMAVSPCDVSVPTDQFPLAGKMKATA